MKHLFTIKNLIILFLPILSIGCSSQAPLYQIGKTPVQIQRDMRMEEKALPVLCKGLEKVTTGSGIAMDTFKNIAKGIVFEIESRGYDKKYCDDPEKYSYLAMHEIKEYYIDKLKVTTSKLKINSCSIGGVYKIKIRGAISPDSSFAIEELLKQSPNCRDNDGKLISSTTVELNSGGGFLKDGYLMGRTLRKFGASTVIKKNTVCASSCAVAFLGGKNRVIENQGIIMFHSPYYKSLNTLGKTEVDCDIPKYELDDLNQYYIEMVGEEAGNRIYERTMLNCSSKDGWVISGNGAAELFKISADS